ncbi:MAG: 3-deoxy-7-phosphoheptulonate synthase [Clostridia bacterium]|nr:3-deoxy-7-phosphoheptulonate synthase [Clostridia bacterium]
MIVVLKANPDKEQLSNLTTWLESQNISIHSSLGLNNLVLGLVGDTSMIDMDLIRSLDIVEDVKRIREPYKNANRKFHPDDTIVDVGGVKIGGGHFAICAGPCSIETEEQMIEVAMGVKNAGATLLRGGAFKPRTSPYAFQGLGGNGIELLIKAKKASGLPVVTEIMEIAQLKYFEEVDMIQVGARNMQNFQLLKELGHVDKPILLKRGLANTIEELLMSAEYIMAGGNHNVILCERGIRTFETATRNTLDISAIPVLKKKTHLPVMIDPSHASGIAELVKPLSLAATAAGADGLMIEVHNDPQHALCDGAQSLTPEKFENVTKAIFAIRPFAMKSEEMSQ